MKSREPLISSESDYYTYHPSAIASRLFLYPTCLGYFYYEPGYFLRRNRFNSFLLMYIVKGECRIELNEKSRRVSAGHFILINTHEPHSYGFDISSEVLWLHFEGPLASTYYETITSLHGHILTCHKPYKAARGLTELLDTFRQALPGNEAGVSATITRLLLTFLDNNETQAGTSTRSQTIEKARSYINEHFSESVSLEELAGQSGLSPYHFTRIFEAETGFTPHQYLIATRINAAKYLLRNPSMPSIKEVAFSTGFGSESSFCSTFRKWVKCTPGEYRGRAFPAT